MNHPVHAVQRIFGTDGDCLQVGGMALTRLAQRVGQTPFYAYERAAISARVGALRAVLPAGVHLHYAMKANPMPAVVALMAGLVDGIDVASGGELKTALDTSFMAEQVTFAGPAKSDREIGCAVAAQVLIHLESEAEMERVAQAGQRLGEVPRVGIRVNPDFQLKHSGMTMGGGAYQFGVDAERVPAMLRRAAALGLDFHGFHIFSGAQNLNAAAIAEAQELSVRLALRLADAGQAPMRVLNVGGGFGIPYFPGQIALDAGALGAGLHLAAATLERASPSTRLVIELGRYLVAEAGIYVCRVVERKLSRDKVFLVTDGGMHHHLAASGNFGQVIRKNYPVVIGNKVRGAQRERVTVVGPLCTPLDLLAEDMDMARAEPGDLVVVFQSGAYGLSASPTAFLGHPPPLEVLV